MFDALVIIFGSRIELGPDLTVVSIHDRQTLDDLGFGQVARVGNQNDLDVIETRAALQLRHELYTREEMLAGRRFPVTGEGDVVDPSQRLRHVVKGLVFEQRAAGCRFDHAIKLDAQLGDVHVAHARLARSVNLTVHAVEVASRIWIEG